MWRQESGFLEMFLAYYSQFEDNLTEKKAYRDFLYDILSLHERYLLYVRTNTHVQYIISCFFIVLFYIFLSSSVKRFLKLWLLRKYCGCFLLFRKLNFQLSVSKFKGRSTYNK